MTNFHTFCHFSQKLFSNFFLFAGNEPRWCCPPYVERPFWLNRSKWVKLTQIGQKWPNFTHFAIFLKNCSVTFFLFAGNEPWWYCPPHAETPFWLNRSKWVKLTKNRSDNDLIYGESQFTQKLISNFFWNFTKWKTMMTSFYSWNIILIESI